jgi:hypothetical protein
MQKINELISRLQKVRKTGDAKWLACCPAHKDRSPSLAIKLSDSDKILLHCFAGCDVQSIVSSVDLELSDLMPERPQGYGRSKPNAPRFNKNELFDCLVFESTLLSLAIRKLLSGDDLAVQDLRRIEQAEELISELAREVRP